MCVVPVGEGKDNPWNCASLGFVHCHGKRHLEWEEFSCVRLANARSGMNREGMSFAVSAHDGDGNDGFAFDDAVFLEDVNLSHLFCTWSCFLVESGKDLDVDGEGRFLKGDD